MPMSPYPVLCYAPGCHAPALYKIAATWSDGATTELKTYGLACAACLPGLLAQAREKRAACRLGAGETLDTCGVYELTRGARARGRARRPDLETQPGPL